MAQIRQILKFKNLKSPESYDNFHKVAKNIERSSVSFYLHIYYVAKFG
jgi:hypothetical protein